MPTTINIDTNVITTINKLNVIDIGDTFSSFEQPKRKIKFKYL